MSWVRPALNRYLRLTEKPHLARATDPGKLRRSFELKSRLFFRSPRGTRAAPQDLAGVSCLHVTTPGTISGGPLILYLHGGGYIFGSPRTHKAMLAQICRRTRLTALLPDYRKAPEHRFPAAVEDALATYRAVAGHRGGVIIGGDSAGGGLTLALTLEILRLGLPKPLGLFCFSPLTDLGFKSAAVRDNDASDVVLPASMAPMMVRMYMGGADPLQPLASPLHGDFTGAPPVWIAVGTTEILLDNSTQLTERLRAQGVDAQLTIEDDLPHVWPIFHTLLPEARRTLDDLAAWISSLPPRSADS